MKDIVCPFYIWDAGRCIYCETLAQNIAEIGLVFNRPKDKDKHKTKF
jgi:hypothetical protein